MAAEWRSDAVLITPEVASTRGWTSCWYWSTSRESVIWATKAMSSAYFLTVVPSQLQELLAFTEMRRGEETQPWGTPVFDWRNPIIPRVEGFLPVCSSGWEIFWPDWRRDKLDRFVCMYGFFYSANTTTSSQFMAHVAAIHAEHLFIQTLQYAPGTSIKTLLKVLTPTSTSQRCVLTLSAHDNSW